MKELARQIALQLLQNADVRTIVNDPQSFVESLVAALVDALGPYARNLADEAAAYALDIANTTLTDDELDQIVDDTRRKFIAFALPALTDSVNGLSARVNDMIASGVALIVVHSALSSDIARAALIAPLIGVTKRLVAGWIQFVDRDVNDAAMSKLADLFAGEDNADAEPTLLTWVAVMDRNTCGANDDPLEHYCRPRHGQAKELSEWAALGMPGSPVLECSMRSTRGASPCRCVLSLHSRAALIQKPVVVSAAIKSGRDRAIADVGVSRQTRTA